MSLALCPITIGEARAWINRIHRHHPAPVSALFAVACQQGEEIVGVATVGRPSARMLQDGYTAEVTRVATDGTRNACSILYGAAWRAARALGYRRLVTYTLPEEGGGIAPCVGIPARRHGRRGLMGQKGQAASGQVADTGEIPVGDDGMKRLAVAICGATGWR